MPKSSGRGFVRLPSALSGFPRLLPASLDLLHPFPQLPSALSGFPRLPSAPSGFPRSPSPLPSALSGFPRSPSPLPSTRSLRLFPAFLVSLRLPSNPLPLSLGSSRLPSIPFTPYPDSPRRFPASLSSLRLFPASLDPLHPFPRLFPAFLDPLHPFPRLFPASLDPLHPSPRLLSASPGPGDGCGPPLAARSLLPVAGGGAQRTPEPARDGLRAGDLGRGAGRGRAPSAAAAGSARGARADRPGGVHSAALRQPQRAPGGLPPAAAARGLLRCPHARRGHPAAPRQLLRTPRYRPAPAGPRRGPRRCRWGRPHQPAQGGRARAPGAVCAAPAAQPGAERHRRCQRTAAAGRGAPGGAGPAGYLSGDTGSSPWINSAGGTQRCVRVSVPAPGSPLGG